MRKARNALAGESAAVVEENKSEEGRCSALLPLSRISSNRVVAGGREGGAGEGGGRGRTAVGGSGVQEEDKQASAGAGGERRGGLADEDGVPNASKRRVAAGGENGGRQVVRASQLPASKDKHRGTKQEQQLKGMGRGLPSTHCSTVPAPGTGRGTALASAIRAGASTAAHSVATATGAATTLLSGAGRGRGAILRPEWGHRGEGGGRGGAQRAHQSEESGMQDAFRRSASHAAALGLGAVAMATGARCSIASSGSSRASFCSARSVSFSVSTAARTAAAGSAAAAAVARASSARGGPSPRVSSASTAGSLYGDSLYGAGPGADGACVKRHQFLKARSGLMRAQKKIGVSNASAAILLGAAAVTEADGGGRGGE